MGRQEFVESHVQGKCEVDQDVEPRVAGSSLLPVPALQELVVISGGASAMSEFFLREATLVP